MATKTEISIIMLRLADAYGKELESRALHIYIQALLEYPRLALVHAQAEIIKKSKWFPRVSEIVQEVERYKNEYGFPDYAKLEEAVRWCMYRKNYSTTDDLTDEDVIKVYAEAGTPMVQEAMVPPEHRAAGPEGW